MWAIFEFCGVVLNLNFLRFYTFIIFITYLCIILEAKKAKNYLSKDKCMLFYTVSFNLTHTVKILPMRFFLKITLLEKCPLRFENYDIQWYSKILKFVNYYSKKIYIYNKHYIINL